MTKLKHFLLSTLLITGTPMALPNNFVYLESVAPTIIQDMKYLTDDNFIGRPIKGYHANKCIISRPAAEQLKKIQQTLIAQSLSLKVFDCYRPQMAVDDFIQWSQDAHDQKMKSKYYPRVNKADFFKLGYVAEKSGHTRGSAVDLTIVHIDTQKEMDMGTIFDFMDEDSHPASENVSAEAKRNRIFLRQLMEHAGFEGIETEWWHFTLKQEPFPETHFNFAVE